MHILDKEGTIQTGKNLSQEQSKDFGKNIESSIHNFKMKLYRMEK